MNTTVKELFSTVEQLSYLCIITSVEASQLRDPDDTVILCPELDIASQGDTIEDARNNLIEALELFFETADSSEIQERLHTEVFVTRLEVNIG